MPSPLYVAKSRLPTCSARVLAVLAGLALAGCAVGPDYRRPDAPPVDHYTAQALPTGTASAMTPGGDAQRFLQGSDVPAQWWTTFDNAELTRRVDTALAHSPSLAAAQAALRQAQENARAARGGLFPALDFGAGATRQKPSAVPPDVRGGFGPFTLYNTAVSVGYTLDLFGGVRRGVEAQLAQADYQRAQLDTTYLTLAANVVTASLQEASLREQLRATEQIVDMLHKSLDIARQQQQIGAKSLSDTLAVRSQLASTEATLPCTRTGTAT